MVGGLDGEKGERQDEVDKRKAVIVPDPVSLPDLDLNL
jgi:hypothetical protein